MKALAALSVREYPTTGTKVVTVRSQKKKPVLIGTGYYGAGKKNESEAKIPSARPA